jgi:hypothetical protein
LTDKRSGKCLSVSGGSLSDGAKAVQATWSGAASQLWTLSFPPAVALTAESALSDSIPMPALTALRAAGKFSAKAPGHDELALKLSLPEALHPAAGALVRLDFAGATTEFTLSKSGSAKSTNGALALATKAAAMSAQVRLNGDFASAWQAAGLDGSAKTATVNLSLEIDGQTFANSVTLQCSVRKGVVKFSQ